MQKEEAIKLLTKLISFQSVSSDPSRHGDLLGAAEFLKETLVNIGFMVELVSTKSNRPLICAYFNNPNAKETVGIYAHYDVQPEDPRDKWNSDPFVLTQKDGKLYGRGIADDKGHVVQAITALKTLINSGKLGYSIVFLIEGEEEAGLAAFEPLLKDVKVCDLSKVDVWFILDMGMKAKGNPQIFTGLRGIVSCEIVIETGESDAHSGIFGNRIYSAAQILTTALGKAKDPNTGEVYISGFYDDVIPVSSREYESLSKYADSPEELKSRSKTYVLPEIFYIPNSLYPQNMSLALSSKLLPSFEINGIWSGYSGAGAKTIIPSRASAKFSVRIVQGQSGDKMKKLIHAFFAGIIPKGVKWSLEMTSSEAVSTHTDNVWVNKTVQILDKHFGSHTEFNRSGGSIPAAEILSRLYNKPIIMTGFTLPDENIHAPNENIDEEMFIEGINVLEKLFSK